MSAEDDPPPPYQAEEPPPAVFPVAAPAPAAQPKIFYVYRSQGGNYRAVLDDKKCLYYVNSRTIRTPDLIVHRGNGDFERQVASCQFPEFTNQYTINVNRQPDNKSNVAHAMMSLGGRFSAPVLVRNLTGAVASVQRPFEWRGAMNRRLVDEETLETAAEMHAVNFVSDKCFLLEIQAQCANTFEILILTSAMALYENQRRQSANLSSHGHRSRARGGGARMAMFGGGAVGGI